MLDTQSVSRATGADLPEELFEDILSYVESPCGTERVEDYPPSRSPVVHSLASLILVCKYFARVCRPKLYRRLSLRSRQQLKTLTSFLEDSNTVFRQPFLSFTASLELHAGEDDGFWIHQVATVLIPRMRHAGIRPFSTVTLKVDKALPGLVPARTHLPRTLPSSLFRHISSLLLANVHFVCGEDLIRSLSAFPSLHSTDLVRCTCGTVEVRPSLCRLRPRDSWARINLIESGTAVPIVVAEVLGSWAGGEPIAIPARDQQDCQLITEIVTLLLHCITSPALGTYCDVLMCAGKSMSIYMGTIRDIARDQFYALHMYPHKEQYALTIFIIKLPMHGAQADIELVRRVWRDLVSCAARLSHLKAFKVSFDSLYLMKAFMGIIYPVLQEIHESGQKMRIGPAGGLVPVSVFLEYFAPLVGEEVSMEEGASGVERSRDGAELGFQEIARKSTPHEPLEYVIELENNFDAA